ncbi:MAG: hypothetical protein CBC13_08865 [Planctomycetia bacterium TMED53]|nr:MAG: hypothetical protein CBC13_08865 [Planctomycetia bacterium TMED53]
MQFNKFTDSVRGFLPPLSSGFSRQGTVALSVSIWVLISFGGHFSDQALAAQAQAQPAMLDEVRYLLFGKERAGIAEVSFEGKQCELRLFNDKLAAYYAVKIPEEDLLSSNPLGVSASAEIHEQRQLLIMTREQERIERRKKAAEAKALERVAKGAGKSSANRASGRSLTTPLQEPIRKGLNKAGYLDLLEEFRSRISELQNRNEKVFDSGQDFLGRLVSWAEDSDAKTRVFHALKSETHSIIEDAEALRKTLVSRMKEIQRTVEQTDQGFLKERDLLEIVDRIRQRLVRCEERVGALESLELACADGLISLGDPIVRTEQIEEAVSDGKQASVKKPLAKKQASRSGRKAEVAARTEDRSAENPKAPTQVVPASYRSGSSEVAAHQAPKKKRVVSEEKEIVKPTAEAALNAEPSSSKPENTSSSGGGARELILGSIFGAILVLLLSRLIKALP